MPHHPPMQSVRLDSRWDIGKMNCCSIVDREDASRKLHETVIVDICDVVGSDRSGRMKAGFTWSMENDVDLSFILIFIVLSFRCITS